MARTKGVNLVPIVKHIRRMDAVAQARLPQNLRGYIDERILVSSWYPEEDVLALMRFLLGAGASKDEAWIEIGRRAASEQARTTYRGFVEGRAVQDLLRHAHVMWRVHHDTGEMATEPLGDTRVRFSLSSYAGLVPETIHTTAGFITGIIEAAGGRKVRCRLTSCDLPARSATWEIDWELPESG